MEQEPFAAVQEASHAGQEQSGNNGVAGTDENVEMIYLPEEKITTTAIAPETTQRVDHFYDPVRSDEENNMTDDGALEAAEGKTYYSESEYIYE